MSEISYESNPDYLLYSSSRKRSCNEGRCLHCTLCAICTLLVLNFLTGAITLFVLSYGVNIAADYKDLAPDVKQLVQRAKTIENKIDVVLHNVTEISKNATKDMTIFTDLGVMLLKHNKTLLELFPFINNTQIFLADAKKCIEKYDVCPNM